MYCSYCGNKIDKDSKFCTFCGREVLENKREENINKPTNYVHDSVVRKAIKKNAKSKSKKPLYIANIIFVIAMIITTSLVVVTMEQVTTNILASIAIFIMITIVSTYFMLGIAKTSLNISRDKETSIGDILKYAFKKPKTYLKVLGINILVYIIANILVYIPIIGSIAYFVLAIYFSPPLAMLTYVVVDDEDISISKAMKKTLEIIKGKRVAYYALTFSFTGWYILSIFTLGLLLIWVIPYITISFSNFYLSITKEKEYSDASTGLSDGAIIGITIGAYIAFITIIVVITFTIAIVSGINEGIKESEPVVPKDNYYDHYNNISGQTVNISGLNVYIPNGYSPTPLESYDKAYFSEEGDIVIGLITTDVGYDTTSYAYASLYKEALSSSYTCSDISTVPINYYNWEVLDCNEGFINIRNYITIKNNKIYLLAITYATDSITEARKIIANIEKELDFTNLVA